MTSQSAPGERVTVTKVLTPNRDCTPSTAKTASAKGLPAAASALARLRVAGSFTSRSYFIALGFGVGDGVAVAISAHAMRHRLRGIPWPGMDPTIRFEELVKGPEDALALDEAALLIAAHARPDLDIAGELRLLDRLAAGIPEGTLDEWRRHLFIDLGYGGHPGRFEDPADSFLDQVIRRRRGLPITLSVLGMEVGRRVGLRFEGVGTP